MSIFSFELIWVSKKISVSDRCYFFLYLIEHNVKNECTFKWVTKTVSNDFGKNISTTHTTVQ